MSSPVPLFVLAREREEGCVCPRCGEAVHQGNAIAVCQDCGTVHHRRCWEQRGGCGSYDCAPARIDVSLDRPEPWRITRDELEGAVPRPPWRPPFRAVPPPAPPGSNRLALAAFLTGLAGIAFFGLLTGPVAILLGGLALGGSRPAGRRGTGLALAGALLGLADTVGWIVLLVTMLSRPGPALSFEEFQWDPAALENLDPVLNRAMRATVLIRAERGLWRGTAIGSGVILSLSGQEALLVTNRHVVDPDFPDSGNGGQEVDHLPPVQVRFLGQPARPGKIVWRAPHGIDLALVRVAGATDQVRAARWQANRPVRVGDPVFAIGNPHGLGWTHTQGTVSQLRRQHPDGHEVHVIQTQTAINPGNSGGGLFDRQGYLVGINTWTNDKRVSEGLSFAISLDTLLELKPPYLKRADAAASLEKP